MTDIVLSNQSRVWFVEGGVSPWASPAYAGCVKIGDSQWGAGDITKIECPDPNAFGKFIEVGQVRGASERVTTSLMGRYGLQLSDLLKMRRAGCRVDLHVAIGTCKNPQDYLRSWEKLVIIRDGLVTSYSKENEGALGADESNPTNETAEISAEEMYEVVQMSLAQIASSYTTSEIVALRVCDALNCSSGNCGEASDGCQKIFAVRQSTPGSPGDAPALLYSSDGGATWSVSPISTLLNTDSATDAMCVGSYIVVLANDLGWHYALIDDVLAGVGVWTASAALAEIPLAGYSVDPRNNFIVCENGYVYLFDDVAATATLLDAGTATVQNLNDVHAYGPTHAVAVGDSNAVIYTVNGTNWSAVTGPDVGVNLNAVWMLSHTMWLVGTASGKLFATKNSGATWVQLSVPGSLTSIDEIEFFDDTVGFIVGQSASGGLIYRTTDGGHSWSSQTTSALLALSDAFNSIAVCDQNTIFAAGLVGSNGVIMKGVPA